jgi:hypothetical protein
MLKTMIKDNWVGRFWNKKSQDIFAWALIGLLGYAVTVLLSMRSNSADGKKAYDDNNKFHPRIEAEIDSLKQCNTKEGYGMQMIIQRLHMSDSVQTEMLKNINEKVEYLYRNEISK